MQLSFKCLGQKVEIFQNWLVYARKYQDYQKWTFQGKKSLKFSKLVWLGPGTSRLSKITFPWLKSWHFLKFTHLGSDTLECSHSTVPTRKSWKLLKFAHLCSRTSRQWNIIIVMWWFGFSDRLTKFCVSILIPHFSLFIQTLHPSASVFQRPWSQWSLSQLNHCVKGWHPHISTSRMNLEKILGDCLDMDAYVLHAKFHQIPSKGMHAPGVWKIVASSTKRTVL